MLCVDVAGCEKVIVAGNPDAQTVLGFFTFGYAKGAFTGEVSRSMLIASGRRGTSTIRIDTT